MSCREPIRFVDSSKTQARKNGLVFPLSRPPKRATCHKVGSRRAKCDANCTKRPQLPPQTTTPYPHRCYHLYHAGLIGTAFQLGVRRRQRPAILIISSVLAGTQPRGQHHPLAYHGVLGLIFVWSNLSQLSASVTLTNEALYLLRCKKWIEGSWHMHNYYLAGEYLCLTRN